MKKNIFIQVLFLATCITLNAQSSRLNRKDIPKTLYYFDDFVDYRNKWQDHESPITKGYIRDGFYHYQNKQTRGSYLRFTYYSINPSANYYFEMEFLLESGDDAKENGFIFNHTSTKRNSNHQFLIAANQTFHIRKQVLGEYYDIVPVTKLSSIRTKGNNKLGILAKGDSLYYYINDIWVHTMQRPVFLGNDIGLVIANQATIAVDKFSIYYNPPAIKAIVEDAREYELADAGSNINTLLDDASPVLSADGKMMFFVRSESLGDSKYTTSKIMYAEYDEKEGSWGQAKAISDEVNRGTPGVVYISPDKNMLVLNATYLEGIKIEDGGLSYAQRTASGWGVPQNMPIDNYYNMDKYESFAISANGKVLIISANCVGSHGQRDLFVSFRKSDGSWGEPKNMGPRINTYGHEDVPCIAPDNKTLYFNSDGLPGYGKTDLFVTHRLDDTWLNWSEPENLGPNINSEMPDNCLQVDADGNYAYTQVRDTFNYQIKRIVLPPAARPEPVVIIKGRVLDIVTKKPVGVPVIYENLENANEEGIANSSPEDGSFVLVMPYGVNYGFTAKQKGYIGESKNIDLRYDTLKKEFAELTIDLFVMPLTEGKSIALNNIFFEPDEYELKEKSFSELDRLVQVMNDNATLQIEIDGHTDRGGPNATKEHLVLLSQNRANSVRDYLMRKGVNSNRINSLGFGNAKPVSDEQRLNRRVEVQIVKL